MNSNVKTAIFWVVIIFGAVLLYAVVHNQKTRVEQQISFTHFMNEVSKGNVKYVSISGSEVRGQFKDESGLRTLIPTNYPDVYKLLQDKNVTVDIKEANSSHWVSMLINAIPFVLLLAFWIFMMRQMQSGGNKALSFGKSRARMHSSQQKKVTFKDVAGVEEAKEELQEIIEFLREPQKFQKLGGRIPKGVLLIGPPGTGKTLLARAIAGEANVPFFSISGSDFVEMFVGVGASRVRDLFEQGKKNAPCIIFIDEIDAVGRHRGAGLGGGHDEREQTLNQLLVEMDGFEMKDNIILIAATNRPDILDPALLRPGRFDRQVVVPLPELDERRAILEVHCKSKRLASDIDLDVVARGTPGMSGADLANLVNEAALFAVRDGSDEIRNSDFEQARDRVLMGQRRDSMALSEAEKEVIAYHEAGHAVCAAVLPNADPVHKVTILPIGMALGVTQQLPVDEKHLYRQDYIEDSLVVRMGGRVAEELVFGVISTGANNDLVGSTELARKMVSEWGMSTRVGPMAWGSSGQVFLGEDLIHTRDYSDETARVIDEETERILRVQEERCRETLRQHRKGLDLVARALLEHETIDGAEVTRLIRVAANGGDVPPAPPAPATPGREAGIEIGPDRGPDAPAPTPSGRPGPGGALAGSRPPYPPPPAPPT